jgi:hypothetical protein
MESPERLEVEGGERVALKVRLPFPSRHVRGSPFEIAYNSMRLLKKNHETIEKNDRTDHPATVTCDMTPFDQFWRANGTTFDCSLCS